MSFGAYCGGLVKQLRPDGDPEEAALCKQFFARINERARRHNCSRSASCCLGCSILRAATANRATKRSSPTGVRGRITGMAKHAKPDNFRNESHFCMDLIELAELSLESNSAIFFG
jgi:hypothetical protein